MKTLYDPREGVGQRYGYHIICRVFIDFVAMDFTFVARTDALRILKGGKAITNDKKDQGVTLQIVSLALQIVRLVVELLKF